MCYSHRPLLDSIATKFLALSDKWGLEDAEHVASIAAACAQLQLDRPRVYITALTYTTDHAMEMSSASLLKLLRAAAHVTAPHNQGAANADSQLSPLAPALTVSHPHQLHSKTEGGGVFYSVVHPGRPAPVVRSTLDSVVSARSTGASMLDIQLQPAFAANLARFVTKACQLLKHDLPDLGLQELAAVVDSCASLSQLQPADDNEVSHTSVFSPVARGRGSSSSTWDETFGADLEAGSGSDGSERVLEGLAAVRLGGGGINRSTQGSAASSKIRTAAADPVFLQQLEGSAVALVGSHIHGDGTQLPVLAQMLLVSAHQIMSGLFTCLQWAGGGRLLAKMLMHPEYRTACTSFRTNQPAAVSQAIDIEIAPPLFPQHCQRICHLITCAICNIVVCGNC